MHKEGLVLLDTHARPFVAAVLLYARHLVTVLRSSLLEGKKEDGRYSPLFRKGSFPPA